MSSLQVWLQGREPAPPEPLAAALRGRVGTAGTEGGDSATGAVGVEPAADAARGALYEAASPALPDVLASAARDRLALAMARPGRDRESAYRLLEADALFTYACEAALERGDAPATLRRILALASG